MLVVFDVEYDDVVDCVFVLCGVPLQCVCVICV